MIIGDFFSSGFTLFCIAQVSYSSHKKIYISVR